MLRIPAGLDSRMTAEPFKSTSQLKLELLANVRSHWSHHKHCKVTWHTDATRPSQSLLYKKRICLCGKHFCCCQVSHQSNGNTVFTDKPPAAIWRHRQEQFLIISSGSETFGGQGAGQNQGTFTAHFHCTCDASAMDSPWGACSFTAECLFSLRLSVFMGTLLPGYFYHICASSMLKFGPVLPEVPHWLESARWLAALLSKRQSSPIFSTERSEYPLLGKSPNTTHASNRTTEDSVIRPWHHQQLLHPVKTYRAAHVVGRSFNRSFKWIKPPLILLLAGKLDNGRPVQAHH